ncbi:hypothetical protein GQ457_04G027190 [Hibiscus cannabinus]
MVTDVASSGTLVKELSVLNADKHIVVRVDPMGEGHETRNSKGRMLPASIRGLATNDSKTQLGVKGVSKTGIKLHKRDDPGKSRMALGDRLSNLASDLDRTAVEKERRLVQPRSSRTEEINKGANDPGFNHCFKLLMKKQVPDIVVIMEPHISREVADRFIRKSGFEFSYRVEAHGLSSGIRLLWKASIHVQILEVSNQYIHTRCFLSGTVYFFGTFVYASLNALRHRTLWYRLLSLNLGVGVPWVVGGDLNVISSSEERLGGSQRRSCISHRFNEFLFASGLMDMGFSGPKFTWRRDNLSQRLDKCLCNSEWFSVFPSLEIHHLLKLGLDHRPILLDTSCLPVGPVVRPFRYLAAWNDHPAFLEFLRTVWGMRWIFCGNVAHFQDQSRRSVSTQISWNGELSDSFRPSHGIRQGDPLSPYLIVICMDHLSQAIESSVIIGRWRSIQLMCRGLSLSHLFFVDNMVLFAEATMEQVGVIQDIVSKVCKVSGHKVSISKTQMCFSRNCALSTKNLIAWGFGFEVVEDLDRITLAKSVLQSIPIYVMQATWLPKGVRQEMEKLIRQFVWGGSGERTGIALLPWDTIQRSPAQGRLGLKDLDNHNKAFLMKIGYNLITDDECLWVQLGEDERLVFSCLLPSPPRPMLVADMVCGSGGWDWSCIEHVLPRELVEQITTVHPPRCDAGADKPIWRWGW